LWQPLLITVVVSFLFVRESCAPEVQEYYNSLKGEQLKSMFTCRDVLEKLNKCTSQYTTPKYFRDETIAFIRERKQEQQQQQQPPKS
jgi:hypothetical protein